MPRFSQVVYIPRSDDVVLQELKDKELPVELKEQLQLVDSYPPNIKEKITEIINRLFRKNQLDGKISYPSIHISNLDTANAMMLIAAKQPILILNKGLLEKVQSEDELAGSIASELGHLVLHEQSKDAAHHNKIEQAAADNQGIMLLNNAGYDPNGIIDHLKNGGGGKAHFTDDDSPDANTRKKAAALVQILLDPQPSDPLRIRVMEDYIANLRRNGEMKEKPPQVTPLEQDFKVQAATITYESPITIELKKIKYSNRPVIEQLDILTCLLDDIYPPTDRTSAERLKEIADHIKQLSVDFNNPAEAEAFNSLADIVMGPISKGKKGGKIFVVHPNGVERLNENLDAALQEVWIRGGKNANCLGRNESLKKELKLFCAAKTKKEAEQHASAIIALCDKIAPEYRSEFRGFYPPTFKEVKSSKRKWHPPYSQHVLWCKEDNSENIKTVLQGMKLSVDPWAAKILGAKIESYFLYFYRLKIANSAIANDTILDEKAKKERVLLSQLIRDEKGTVIGSITPKEPYKWKLFPPHIALEELKNNHRIQGEKKRQYEEQIVNTTDWQLLRTDFPRFIMIYGRLLHHYYSIVPVPSPFSQRFFEELSTFLPAADENFITQVQDFFREYPSSPIPHHPETLYHFYDLYVKENMWPYEDHIPRSRYWNSYNPFIKFLLENPLSSMVIRDETKISRLVGVPGFLKPDPNKKLMDIFPTSFSSILAHYPKNIKTVADLEAVCEKYPRPYEPITLVLEAERLAYQFADSITMEEFLVLDEARALLDGFQYREYACNIESFFNALRHKTAQRYLNTNDCFELIKNYKYAMVHNFLLDAPSIKDSAHAQMRQLISQMPVKEKIACLKDLFEPKTFSYRVQFALQLEKKYDGYITEPEFRNWAIEEFTNALATHLGEDDGSADYVERARPVIEDLAKNTVGLTQLSIFSLLATKINAQKEVAYLLRDAYNNCKVRSTLAKNYEGIAIELLIKESSTDPILRQHILDYLANPLTQDSHKPLRNYLQKKGNIPRSLERIIFTAVIDDQLRTYHKNFRAASLEIKSAYLEPILFPLNSSEEKQRQIIEKLISDVFPLRANSKSITNNNDYAQLIVRSYLQAVKLSESRLLSTALFITNMREQETVERTVGQKLNMILSHMGPAGGKLLQAIHSHPQTPADLKKDIASAKVMFAPPLRWELVEYIEKSGLFVASEQNPHPVKNIGKLAGAGSFGLTVINTLSDQTSVADTFLRENAAKQAERELGIMSQAAQQIVQSRPELSPITFMVEEAQRSAQDETNMDCAKVANQYAEGAYHEVRVLVGEYEFTHQVMALQKTGEHFKRVTVAQGEHFNELLKHSFYKKALAKAMIATQLSLRLAGCTTDLDRHGGNIKVQGNSINHFDFGAMNVTALTEEDKTITGRILAETVLAAAKGKNFSNALLNSIQNAQVSAASRIYLNGLNKDFFALGDYIDEVDPNELGNLIAKCLLADTMDPQINAAFKLGLGSYAPVVYKHLQKKAQDIDVQVVLDRHASIEPQIKKEFQKKALVLRADHVVRYAHLDQSTFHDGTVNEAVLSDEKYLHLATRINELEEYGQSLKKSGKCKGEQVINLAKNLRQEVSGCVEHNLAKEEATPRIQALMQQGKLIMREDRRGLDILAHIFIALTVIGFAFMVAQKVLTGTFFFNRTKRESLLAEVEADVAYNHLSNAVG